MAQLIKLNRADNGSAAFSNEITVSVRNILLIEDFNGQNGEHSRIYLEGGKSLYVTETQDEIAELANSGSGGGLF